jgi:hypothetical protein
MLLLSVPLMGYVHTASANQGTIILSPSHGTPGTLIMFQGVGWYLDRVDYCWVDGKPVKIDIYAVCEVRYSSIPLVTVIATGGTVYGQSSLEPSGTFVVANIPPGTYSVTVAIGSPTNVVSEQPFTVDGAIVETATTTRTERTTASVVISETLNTSPLTITMIVTTTALQNPEMLNSSTARATIVALGAIVAVLALALIVVLRRVGQTKRKRQRA